MIIEKMEEKHLPGVMTVEKLSFKIPWSINSFIQEITTNDLAHYLVAVENNMVVGYAGMWQIQNEGHITNIAVHPEFRGVHIGKGLMHALILLAKNLGIDSMTLEVRRSNMVAQNMYNSFGFTEAGVRKAYYSDNKEDAIVMWNHHI